MDKSAEDFYNCPICMEVAKNAVESDCCNSIFCENCLNSLNKQTCPLCRKESIKWKANIVIRRMISSLKTECPDCKEQSTIGNLPDHRKKCIKVTVFCRFPKCEYTSKREDYHSHLVEAHLHDLAELYGTEESTEKGTLDASSLLSSSKLKLSSSSSSSTSNTLPKSTTILDPIAFQKNSRGNTAKLGESGSFYCGGKLEGSCNCCDGNCGPTNGCCCKSCMKLNIAARKLEPGYYVNKEGAVCKLVGKTVYCGRYFKKVSFGHDGHCGPNNGPQCEPCKILQNHLSIRYAGVHSN